MLATRVVIVGLVPFLISTVLSTYLIMDVVVGPRIGVIAASIVAVPLLLLWWLFPLLRVHDGRHPGSGRLTLPARFPDASGTLYPCARHTGRLSQHCTRRGGQP